MKPWVGGNRQWKFGGKHRVGRKEKHTWTVLRGSVAGRVTRLPSARAGLSSWGCLPVFNIKTPTNPTREDFKHPKSPLRETITTLLTEQTFLEFSHILLAEKIPVQCWALDVFHIWFHSWKWAPRHHYSPDISGLTHEVMSSCCPAVWFDERLVMHIKWFSIIRLKYLI